MHKGLPFFLIIVLLSGVVYGMTQIGYGDPESIAKAVFGAIIVIAILRIFGPRFLSLFSKKRAVSGARFMLTPTPLRTPEIAAVHRQRLTQGQTQVTDYTPPPMRIAQRVQHQQTHTVLSAGATRTSEPPRTVTPPVAPFPFRTTYTTPTRPPSRVVLGQGIEMPLGVALTSAIIDELAVPGGEVLPLFLEDFLRFGFGMLIIDMDQRCASIVANLAPGFGFLAGSSLHANQEKLPPALQGRYFPLAQQREAAMVGRGIVSSGLQVVYDWSSFENDTVAAGTMLLALLQGIAQAPVGDKPVALFVLHAGELLPEYVEDARIKDADLAQEVNDQLLEAIEQAGHVPNRAVYLITSTLAGIEAEALDQSRLLIVNTADTAEISRICIYTGRPASQYAMLRSGQSLLSDLSDPQAVPFSFQPRRSSLLLAPPKGVSAQPRKPAATARPLADQATIVMSPPPPPQSANEPNTRFTAEELAFASYLYATGRLTQAAIRRPRAEMVTAVRAAGLQFVEGTDLMRGSRAKTLLDTILAMSAQERAGHAAPVRQRLAQRGGATGSDGDPPREQGVTAPGRSAPTFWRLPPPRLLAAPQPTPSISEDELVALAGIVSKVLSSHRVNAEVRPSDISIGARTLRIGVRPTTGADGKLTRVDQIKKLHDDFKLHLGAKTLRMETPVAGHHYVGIEIPNPYPMNITLRELLESPTFKQEARSSKLVVALGKDMTNAVRVICIPKMPHALIAGMTGSGKSILLHTITTGILMQASPEDVRLLIIDPKQTELVVYEGIPHLLRPIVTDPEEAASVLEWAVEETDRRNRVLAGARVRNIDDYHRKQAALVAQGDYSLKERLPYIVILIDELQHLMMTAPDEVEKAICKIAQLSRAAGIHLIVATQRPAVEVVTGQIKANLPTRAACKVLSHHDSQTILDMPGAEELLGSGDMLFLSADAGIPDRMQGPFLNSTEVEAIAQFWIQQSQGIPPTNVIALPLRKASTAVPVTQPPLDAQWTPTATPGARGARTPLTKTGAIPPEQVELYIQQFLKGEELPFTFGDSTRMSDARPSLKSNDQLARFVEAWARNEEEVSISEIRRVFHIGHARSLDMMTRLEGQGIVGPDPGNGKKRSVRVQQGTQAEEEIPSQTGEATA